MFTKFTSTLDRAVLLSVVAMLGFNVVVLAQQLDGAALAALTAGVSGTVSAQQA